MYVGVRERKSRCEGTAISAWFGFGFEERSRKQRHDVTDTVLPFFYSLDSLVEQQSGRMRARLGTGERDCSDDSTRPQPPLKPAGQHQYPNIVFPLCGCSLDHSAWWWPAPAIMPAPEDAPRLPQSFCLGRREGLETAVYARGLALLRLLHYLTQGDGASGEGPDAAKAEGRCVRCERGGGVRQDGSRILGGKGGPTPSPRLRRSPAPQARSPRDRAGGSRVLLVCLSSLRRRGRAREGVGGGGVRGKGGKCGCGISWASLSLFCGCLGPGIRVVYEFFGMHACMQVRPPAETRTCWAEVTGRF